MGMTIVYRGERWYLRDEEVLIHPAGEEPRRVELDQLPLPVARVLRLMRAGQAA